MKKLILILSVFPLSLFGQFNSSNKLDNKIENIKQNVSSIIEKIYYSDKNGKNDNEPYESRVFFINKNKQITSVNWFQTKDNFNITYFYKYEETNPYLLKQEIIEGNFVHENDIFTYIKKNTTTGSNIYKNFKENNQTFREFVLDKNQYITAIYEYYNGNKSFTGFLYEYNNQGYIVKETRLYYDKPREITTYKLNEHGDVIEKLEFDVNNNKFSWKYEYSYSYDNSYNWVSKKEIMIGFKENGKLENKSDYRYKTYTREIKY
jgi:hypothetical protein